MALAMSTTDQQGWRELIFEGAAPYIKQGAKPPYKGNKF